MKIDLQRIEPPFWWVGMKNKRILLLVYGNNIGQTIPETKQSNLKIINIQHVDNKNYLFIDVEMPENSSPALNTIQFKYAGQTVAAYDFEIKIRTYKNRLHKGFDASDVVYLIMPDRFACDNSDTEMPDGYEKVDRQNPNARHGGTLNGVVQKVDYLRDLGVTTIWLNPFLENNMPAYSYHGYAITDFYKTDPRLGKNQTVVELAKQCHDKGMKLIKDVVLNHCGVNHWFIKDMPTDDWVHQFPVYTQTNHCIAAYSDIHKANSDLFLQHNGWFDRSMPDLNQTNPFLAQYLIQNTIWWIEYAELDGIRVDTYPYPDRDFMVRWNNSVFGQYPDINVVGEVWVHDSALTAYWQKDAPNIDGFNSALPTVTDFPWRNAIVEALSENETVATGLIKIYNLLSKDFLYANTNNLLIFLDNHDLTRIYTRLNHNYNKFKIAITLLLTMRGIPQIYYGTEFLMDGFEHEGHGFIRQDVPGGWTDDENNFFINKELSIDEQNAFDFIKKLLNWRKQKKVVHFGKLIHFVPQNGIYVYFRILDNTKIMIIINVFNKRNINTDRYREYIGTHTKGRDIISGRDVDLSRTVSISGMSSMIIEF